MLTDADASFIYGLIFLSLSVVCLFVVLWMLFWRK